MIPKQEIMALAAELQLQAHVVETDYALGWFLAGIAAHPEAFAAEPPIGSTCSQCLPASASATSTTMRCVPSRGRPG